VAGGEPDAEQCQPIMAPALRRHCTVPLQCAGELFVRRSSVARGASAALTISASCRIAQAPGSKQGQQWQTARGVRKLYTSTSPGTACDKLQKEGRQAHGGACSPQLLVPRTAAALGRVCVKRA